MSGPVVSRAEFADRLGIDPGSVTRQVARGRLPAPDGRLGNLPWWLPATVDAAVAARAAAAAAHEAMTRAARIVDGSGP